MFGGAEGKDLLPFIQAKVNNGDPVAEEDVEPEISLAAQSIIRVYNQVAHWRTSGGFGPNAISLQDISVYCVLNGFMLNSFEVECIKVIDTAFLANFKTGK